MSEYIGEVGKRITITAKLVNDYTFTRRFGRLEQDTNIYTFEDESGNVFCWKTSGSLGIAGHVVRDGIRDYRYEAVHRGDTFTCKATVKEHSEYKGTKQTVVTRVKVENIVHAPTKEEIDEARAEEQRATLSDGDIVWRMPYKQYKEHYADCETIAGSFFRDEHRGEATIEVIVRKGRLVPSGVRGKHFSGYQFKSDDGGLVCYRAVSEETARRQLIKEHPDGQSWPCVKVFDYIRDAALCW